MIDLPDPIIALNVFGYVWLWIGLALSLLAGICVALCLIDYLVTRITNWTNSYSTIIEYAFLRKEFKKWLDQHKQQSR